MSRLGISPRQGLPLWAIALGLGLVAPLQAMPAKPQADPGLTAKESFMLMFGKGNGAMRVLCALQKEGLIDQATRIRLTRTLVELVSERGDSAQDRSSARLGMAFADARPGLCPSRVMDRADP